jgi:hypothetical protein
MKKENSTQIIEERKRLLTNAINMMAEYVRDPFPNAYPSKEQTEAVNAYLDSLFTSKHDPMMPYESERRRISSMNIIIAAIYSCSGSELARMQEVLEQIAYNRDYYMPEKA